MLPLDHGTMLGRVAGLEDPVRALEAFVPLSCDGFLIGPGRASRSSSLFANRTAPARLLTIDSYWNAGEGGTTAMIAGVSTAAALGVDAVKLLMPWNTPAPVRAATVSMLSSVVEAAAPLGIPVMAEPIAFEMERGSEAVKIEADGCRVAMELGVDILKGGLPRRRGHIGVVAGRAPPPDRHAGWSSRRYGRRPRLHGGRRHESRCQRHRHRPPGVAAAP